MLTLHFQFIITRTLMELKKNSYPFFFLHNSS